MEREIVQQIIELEVEEDEDPFDGLTGTEVADVYQHLKPEDWHLFRHFKKFHATYYKLYRDNVPSHHLARGIVSQIFCGILARDKETIANARVEILVAERLKDLCKNSVWLSQLNYRPTD